MLESLQWYTTGLSDPRSSLHQEADRDFANARRKALLRRVVAFLRRNPRSDELLSSPVSLYKVGDAYFVSYGHHRVLVTRYHGIEWIDARMTELYGPSGPETRPPALRRHRDARRDRERSRERNGPARKFRAPRSTESPANYRRSSGGAPGAHD